MLDGILIFLVFASIELVKLSKFFFVPYIVSTPFFLLRLCKSNDNLFWLFLSVRMLSNFWFLESYGSSVNRKLDSLKQSSIFEGSYWSIQLDIYWNYCRSCTSRCFFEFADSCTSWDDILNFWIIRWTKFFNWLCNVSI